MNLCEKFSFKGDFNSLVRELRISNRHFVQNPILEKIQGFVQDPNQYDVITQEKPLFRARVYTEECNEKLGLKDGFDGFDEKESGAPPASLCKENRANGKGIRRLYVAESVDTAIAEIKPLMNDAVSVAEVRMNYGVEVLDLTKPPKEKDSSDEKEYLRYLINKQFAISCSGDSEGYSFTQWFSDLVYDLVRGDPKARQPQRRGIKYSSAMHLEGKNLVILGLWVDSDPSKEHDSEAIFGYKTINSKRYCISDVRYTYAQVAKYVES
jgi:hypothetical protein